MQFTLLSLMAVLPVVFTAPTAQPNGHLEKRFVEETPWHISDFKYFVPSAGSSKNLTLSFNFCDTNSGIEMETKCKRTIANEVNATLVDPNDYYLCNNDTVTFQFHGDSINITRTYIDLS